MATVRSWGRPASADHHVVPVFDRDAAQELVVAPGTKGLAVGMHRSYGDESLNGGGRLWDMRGLDRLISFDPTTGLLRLEAGCTIGAVQQALMSQGWTLPVVPGTSAVTVGGAVANDVHGKNHPVAGSFGHHVVGLTLLRTDGDVIECGPTTRPEWFAATVGGMGLTGVILTATLRLERCPGPWMEVRSRPFSSLGECLAAHEETRETRFDHEVAWLNISRGDGSGVLTHGAVSSHAPARQGGWRPRRLPLAPPVSLVNRSTARVHDALHARLAVRDPLGPVRREQVLQPLDRVTNWNLAYGPRGFHQYQCALPGPAAADGLTDILACLGRTRVPALLATLKWFGAMAPVGLMSFPLPGVTLSVDLPEQGSRTARLFTELDRVVMACGGRLYAAKDGRAPRRVFDAGYPETVRFVDYLDPGISSDLARRLIEEA